MLDGEDVQHVTFENSNSYFNELVITKALDTGYTFNRTPCWTKLTQLGPGTVEGSVTADNLTAPVTIRILRDSVEVAKTTSKDGSYLINDLSDGVYTMEISSPGHVTRRCTIQLKDREPILGMEIELVVPGNINGVSVRGEDVEITDVACMYAFLTTGDRSQSNIDDEAYFLAVADVNGDDSADVYDLQLLYETVSGIA